MIESLAPLPKAPSSTESPEGELPHSLEISEGWSFALDAENRGKVTGWPDEIPEGAEKLTAGYPLEYWHPGYDGVAWYWREVSFEELADEPVKLVRFGAVGYWCEAWLNGHPIGTHEGSYDGFFFDVTPYLRASGGNLLAVRVINPPSDREIEGLRSGAPLNQSNLPIGKAAWYYNFGGLWGRVWLETLPAIHWEDLWVDADQPSKTIRLHWTVRNVSEVDECEILVVVKERESGKTVLEASQTQVIGCGETEGAWTLDCPGFREWSVEEPFLYVLEARLISSHRAHQLARSFGLREFTVSHGLFTLNGQPVHLKGLLQQGSYPRRLGGSPSWRLAARELIAMKRAGFNFLRVHLNPVEDWYLDFADRLGILIMMEPPIGWIANTPMTEQRVRREIEVLIRAHRSRTSLVVWGLFNESFHLLGFTPERFGELAERMMHVAREFDDSRLLIDTSGGYAKAAVQGAETMIHDTCGNGASRYMLPRSSDLRRMVDVHAYCAMPPAPAVVDNYRKIDPGHFPLFISEYGAAEMPPDFAKVLARYSDRDREIGLEDWKLHRDFQESLAGRFAQAGLESDFGTVQNWIAQLNDERARETASVTISARRNPRVAGLCHCQLADASGELFGVLDFWRRPKLALATLTEAFADPATALFPRKRWITAGEALEADFVIVSDTLKAKCGGYEIDLIPPGGAPRHIKSGFFTCQSQHPYELPILVHPEDQGIHILRARVELPGGHLLECSEKFGVLGRQPSEPAIRVTTRFARRETAILADSCGLEREPFGNNYRDKDAVVMLEWAAIAAAVNGHGEMLGQIRNIVESGGAAVILNPDTPMLFQWLLPSFIGIQPVMRTGVYLKPSLLLEGIPSGCVAGTLHASLLGDRWDNGDHVAAAGGIIEIGAFSQHMWTRPAKYFWGAGLYRIPLGRGQLIISHLDLLPNLDHDPLARKMLHNLAAYAHSFIQPGGHELLFRRCIDRIEEKRES